VTAVVASAFDVRKSGALQEGFDARRLVVPDLEGQYSTCLQMRACFRDQPAHDLETVAAAVEGQVRFEFADVRL
jgi:hypothetical protein